jgi:type IX secretion system PorP/SprF family membrane protein
MPKLFLSCLLAVWAHALFAQQDPLYAQYFNNPILLNPAYTGSQSNWQNVIGYRSQWGGFEGNPKSLSFSSHMPLVNNKVGLGLVFVQDKIGEITNTSVNFNYSYKIEKDLHSIHFGLSTGFTRYSVDAGDLTLYDVTDPNFKSFNETQFNTGAGIMFRSDKYIVGLSVPRILPSRISAGEHSLQVYQQHFYLYGGYVFYMNERWRFRPALLLKGTKGAPISADLNFNFVLDDKYTAGLLTRNGNTFGILLQGKIKEYRLGYVFEVPAGRSVGQRFTSHEITLTMSLPVLSSHEPSFSNF